jgi:CxxC motif-containing protein
MGCKFVVGLKNGNCIIEDGKKCKKGREFIINEALNPKRMLTSSIYVKNGIWPLVSVKSSKPIPKEKLNLILKEIKKKKINAPVSIGDIIINNSANTDINIIATKSVKKIN